MTKVKFCGLKRPEEIQWANELKPDYVGFLLAPGRKRTVTTEEAAMLKQALDAQIPAVGVFVDETPEKAAQLLESGVIDIAQLHGREDEAYLAKLRELTDKPILQAFQLGSPGTEAGEASKPAWTAVLERINHSTADMVLIDSGAGSGRVLDWSVLKGVKRPFILAGGLGPENAAQAISAASPYGLDVSSGIETEGRKDRKKMQAFLEAVRGQDRIGEES